MLSVIGRVTKDLEIQTTTSGKQYISFDVAENKGFGENARTQFHRCTIWGEEPSNRIAKAGVKKGSLIHIVGDQDISAFKRASGDIDAQSNITVWHWEYVPGGHKKSDETGNAETGSYDDIPTEDCDDDLPV